MASLLFPDSGTRMAILPSGRYAAYAYGYLYADEDLTVPAEVYEDDDGVKGALIAADLDGRVSVRLDEFGQQPNYWGPADATDRLWIVVNGVVSAVSADYDARLDILESTSSADSLVLHKSGAETVTGAKTFTVSPVVPTPVSGSAAATADYADAAAADAADAAQAFAVQRENHTGTQAHTTVTGLGAAATKNVGTASTDVAAGDAPAAAQTAAVSAAATDATTKADAAQAYAIQGANHISAISAKTSAYTLTSADRAVEVDATSAPVTITVPTAVGAGGKMYEVKRVNVGANAVTVATTSGQTIDGASTFVLGHPWETVELISNGTVWRTLGRRDIPSINVIDHGADPTGVASSDAGFTAAFAAAITGGSPASSTRTAVKKIRIPDGSYKVTQPWDIKSVQGLEVEGEGMNSAILVSGALDSALSLMGVAYSEFRNFEIRGLTGSDTVTSAVALDWDGGATANRSSTTNAFRRVSVRGKYVNAFALGLLSGSFQVDQVTVEKCAAYGQWLDGDTTWWQNGFVSGSGTHANPLNHNYISSNAGANRFNCYANACNVDWRGGSLGHSEADFKHVGARPLSAGGFRSESSQRLLYQPGGASFLSTVSLRDILWNGDAINADGRFILMGYPGELCIDNVIVSEHAANPIVYFSSAQSRTLHVTVRGMRTRTAVDSVVQSNSATTAPATVSIEGYTQVDAAGAPVTATSAWRPTPPRVTSVTSSATPTPNAANTDEYHITALAVDATFGAPTGGPIRGQSLLFRIKDDGSARALSWNAAYRGIGVTLPPTTVPGKVLYVGAKYDPGDSKWDVVGVAVET